MLMKICTIFDCKAEAYRQPMFFQSTAQAVRSFSDVVNDQKHDIGQHPEDYTLFCIGEWDERKGEVLVRQPESLAQGIHCLLPSEGMNEARQLQVAE